MSRWALANLRKLNHTKFRVGFFRARIRVAIPLLLALTALCMFPGLVLGHDISASQSRIDLQGRIARANIRVNLLELKYVDVNGNGVVSYDELDAAIDRVYNDIKQNYI